MKTETYKKLAITKVINGMGYKKDTMKMEY